MRSATVLAIFAVLFYSALGNSLARTARSVANLNIGPFTDVTSESVYDRWNALNPENVRGHTFAANTGAGKLWLVSRRMYRPGFDTPWDPALRGGVVSTLQLDTKVWSHKAYDQIDEDPRGEVMFVAANRLFMLTYSQESGARVTLRRLFYWKDAEQTWTEAALTVEATPQPETPAFRYAIPAIDVLAPKSDEPVAYVVTSSHAAAQRGSQMDFFKLEIETTPVVKATAKQLARKIEDEPSAVKAMAVKGDKLIAFVANFYSEGYVYEYGKAYALDLSSKEITTVQTSGRPPIAHTHTGVNFFNIDDAALVTGGSYTYGLANTASTNQTWALDLSTMAWSELSTQLPERPGVLAFDRQGKKLYAVDLRTGVKVASLTA